MSEAQNVSTVQEPAEELVQRLEIALSWVPSYWDRKARLDDISELASRLAVAWEEIRVREESQIPMIPRAAQEQLQSLLVAMQQILMWATPVGKDYDEDTAFTEIRRIARETLGER